TTALKGSTTSTCVQVLTFIGVFFFEFYVRLLSGDDFGLDNSVHHLVTIVGIGAGLAHQKCGSEMVAALWITEISSPFLHMRELLKEIGYHDTDLNLAVDVLFAFIFSFARMIGGPYLTYVTLTADNHVLIKV
ncbi:transmembrane protein 136-like, partial [Asparagus officinalis]|uniref:transmembrane protein 136-like n=1 Tax=Asparagus officinalis TaxID=4686 RepID=UPI00098DED4F